MCDMRQLLCAVMIALMLTPAMVCGPFMPAAHAAESETAAPCHEQPPQQAGEDHSLTFFKDCYGIELQQADSDSAVKQPVFTIEKITFPWMASAADSAVFPHRFYDSHGPPSGQLAALSPSSPVFLKTGRLRL